jgi:hypothetical protein
VDNEKGRPGLSIVPGGGGIFCSFAILLFCISQWEGGTDVRLGGSNSPETTAWGAFFFIVIFFSVSYHSSLRFYVLLERKEKFQLIIFFWLFVSMTSYFVVRGSGGRVVRCMSFILESWLDVCHYSSNRGIPSDELCFCILDG